MKALKVFKTGKAAGLSGVVSEIIKATGDKRVPWLTSIAEGRIAVDWKSSIAVPLCKGNGDSLE